MPNLKSDLYVTTNTNKTKHYIINLIKRVHFESYLDFLK